MDEYERHTDNEDAAQDRERAYEMAPASWTVDLNDAIYAKYDREHPGTVEPIPKTGCVFDRTSDKRCGRCSDCREAKL
jgi:hypothetical protein